MVNPMAEAKPPFWLAGLQRANESRARRQGQTMTLEHAVRLVLWAQGMRAFPSVRDFVDRWGCNRATAYRWRSALASAYGVVPPPNPPGDSCNERRPGRAPLHARCVS